MKLTPKQAHVVFTIIMVGTMTFIMTGVTSYVNPGFTLHFSKWMHNWLIAYGVALPIMMLLSPPLRKFIGKHTKQPV
jgi:hypothetical protein